MPGRSVSETLLLWFFVDFESPFDLITSVWCHVNLLVLHLRFRKYDLLVKVSPHMSKCKIAWVESDFAAKYCFDLTPIIVTMTAPFSNPTEDISKSAEQKL